MSNLQINNCSQCELKNDVIVGLIAEIRQLKADAKHDAEVCYDVDDKHIAEIKELQADNKQLQNQVDKYGALRHDELQAENSKLIDNNIKLEDKLNRLIKQVSSNSSNSTSTHTHTISGEISEYMDHNDINKAYIFVVDADAVNEDGYIADSHAVSTIQDSNCVSIV